MSSQGTNYSLFRLGHQKFLVRRIGFDFESGFSDTPEANEIGCSFSEVVETNTLRLFVEESPHRTNRPREEVSIVTAGPESPFCNELVARNNSDRKSRRSSSRKKSLDTVT